jgi:hypothetical protein
MAYSTCGICVGRELVEWDDLMQPEEDPAVHVHTLLLVICGVQRRNTHATFK